MRTNLASRHRMQSAAAALTVIAAIAAPPPARGQAMVKPHREDAAAEFARFLPPVVPVPWLEAKRQVPERHPEVSRAAANRAVWLLALPPVPAWSSSRTRAASASVGYTGM